MQKPIHLAYQSLNTDECEMAIAGGVNLILNPQSTVALCMTRALAPDSHCKTFDASADGYVRSEGCGLVVLKKLSRAKAHGDKILALIRGTAVNHDGRSSGLTAPNGPAQELVISQALTNGGIDPALISYVETHGTGTPLGDPMDPTEISA